MQKFLRITFGDEPFIIPVGAIVKVKRGSTSGIKAFLNLTGHTTSGNTEVLGYKITASSADDLAKTKEQLTAFVNEMKAALESGWTNPIYDVKLPYPVTGVVAIQEVWE
jgi:hypothetical protein